RGLGSILLEHLAAAAQERGIRRFTAEVLSQNTKMLRVFIDAGYAVHREYDSGVVDLLFDIEPTEKSRAVPGNTGRRPGRSPGCSRRSRSRSSAPPTIPPNSATSCCSTCCAATWPGRCTR
ncbi:MAG TPA: GNAT family N-acetyltransferase, partial [Nakamurella sp.]|nr:GNAT family N-acetyltransferase [Nakamurella sp.]